MMADAGYELTTHQGIATRDGRLLCRFSAIRRSCDPGITTSNWKSPRIRFQTNADVPSFLRIPGRLRISES